MLTQYEEKMTKTVENLEGEYATIRAGRANPNILNKIKVEYYGVPTPMQQLANITVPEARTLMIAPWEPSLVKAIEKAILNSDLGLTPNNDGKNIILNFPELTEERRKEIVKDIKKKGENAKVAIRNIRRDANDAIKKMEKAGDISEDELKTNEDKIQKMTDKYVGLRQLRENVAPKASISGTDRAGRITLPYESEEQLAELLSRLGLSVELSEAKPE